MVTLARGMSSDDVRRLQEALNAAGFSPGDVDGDFGAGTEAAVLAFQKSEGLLADGVAGPRTLAALRLTDDDGLPSAVPGVTVDIVSRMFPATPVRNIKANLPVVLREMATADLVDKPMVLMALCTIRAETESFLPVSEGQSQYNTSPGGHPYDLYDKRKDLGNQGAPDGERFRGRGFVQLTGRANYTAYGPRLGLGDGLVADPDLANDPAIAARLLALFLGDREIRIKEALLAGDLRAARRLVNGGSNGLDRFSEAYAIGAKLIA